MTQERTRALFLNAEGIEALTHLEDYMRDGGVMDCSEISVEDRYVEAKVKLQNEYGKALNIEAHLLIPHHFIDLVVLNEVKRKPIGFK